jgi:hypothetical protein
MPDTPASTRTQDEIAARIRAIPDDLFGFRTEVLAAMLDVEHLREFCKADADLDGYEPLTAEAQVEEARRYLEFAFGKALDHRGISASRSVDKMREHAWLMGRDDVVEAMQRAEYAQYGVPILFAFANGMDWPIPDDPDLRRMADGLPCTPDCDNGCGS